MTPLQYKILENQSQLFLSLQETIQLYQKNSLNKYSYDTAQFITAIVQEEAIQFLIQYPDIKPFIFNEFVKELFRYIDDSFIAVIMNLPANYSTPITIYLKETPYYYKTIFINGLNYYLKTAFNESIHERNKRITKIINEIKEDNIILNLLHAPDPNNERIIIQMLSEICENHYFLSEQEILTITKNLCNACNLNEGCFNTQEPNSKTLIILLDKYRILINNANHYAQ